MQDITPEQGVAQANDLTTAIGKLFADVTSPVIAITLGSVVSGWVLTYDTAERDEILNKFMTMVRTQVIDLGPVVDAVNEAKRIRPN